MRMTRSLALVAATSMSLAGLISPIASTSSTRASSRSKRISGNDPQINRWTGQPHEHKREIARRLKQAARKG